RPASRDPYLSTRAPIEAPSKVHSSTSAPLSATAQRGSGPNRFPERGRGKKLGLGRAPAPHEEEAADHDHDQDDHGRDDLVGRDGRRYQVHHLSYKIGRAHV